MVAVSHSVRTDHLRLRRSSKAVHSEASRRLGGSGDVPLIRSLSPFILSLILIRLRLTSSCTFQCHVYLFVSCNDSILISIVLIEQKTHRPSSRTAGVIHRWQISSAIVVMRTDSAYVACQPCLISSSDREISTVVQCALATPTSAPGFSSSLRRSKIDESLAKHSPWHTLTRLHTSAS